MVLQSTGAISASQVNTEIGRSATASFNMNDTTIRTLAAKTTTNSQIKFSDFYGKSLLEKWAVSVDSTGNDLGSSVAVDASGNVYVTGFYGGGESTIYNPDNVSSGLTLRATSGGVAAFVVKYNSSGTAQWAVSVDGTNSDEGRSVAVDASGNVYLAGQYGTGVATIYNANNVSSGLTLRATSGGIAAFVVKYNASGAAQWAVSVDGTGSEAGSSIAVDASNNVYLSGYYGSGAATIYNANNASSGLTLRTATIWAAFVVKYNSSGIAQWAVSVDGAGYEVGNGVAVDASGNVYLAGQYGGFYGLAATIYNANNVSSGLTLRASNNFTAGYVVKYNASGAAQWAVSVDGNVDGYGVAVDTNGNVYLCGHHKSGSATFYNANNVSSGLSVVTGTAFVVKYNGSGAAQWVGSADGSGRGVAVNSSGNVVFLTGAYGPGSQSTIYNNNDSSYLPYTLRPTLNSGLFLVRFQL